MLKPVVWMTLFIASAAWAMDFKADPDHSDVGFTVRHMVSRVNGQFKTFDSQFRFDPDHPEKSQVSATVQIASIETNSEKRNNHLKSPDFFDAAKYPTMTFASKKVTRKGKNKFLMMGELTMHGVTKPVSFQVEYLGQSKDPWGNLRAGFTATTKLNRKDFGLLWNKKLDSGGWLIGDDVDVNLNVEGIADKK